ncbi:hypothetical protein ACMXZU_04520 [Corynebacterium striatum]
MSSINDLGSISPEPPQGWQPGVVYDGEQGYITTPPSDEVNHEDVARILEASRLNPDDFVVDWSKTARITTHIKDGELVQAWYKLPFYRKPERSFDVDELINHIHNTEIVDAEIVDGWRTIMLTDQHIGKADWAGGGTGQIIERWKESVTRAIGGNQYEGLNIVFGGDSIEGFVSQDGKNISGTDLVLTEQISIAQHLTVWTLSKARNHAKHVTVAAVPGNHSESTRKQGMPMSDNFDLMIVKNAQQALELAGAADNMTFHYPQYSEGSVTYEAGGATFCVAHGHKFKGQLKGAENWWAGHIANNRHPAKANILLSGHFHNFQAANWTKDRWILFGPSLENESTWFANSTGATSRPGVLTFETVDGEPRKIEVV